jgi:hypothetical protein
MIMFTFCLFPYVWKEIAICFLQVVIYPLKIHLTETMYKMMWEYFFPEEEQDSKKPQVSLQIRNFFLSAV